MANLLKPVLSRVLSIPKGESEHTRLEELAHKIENLQPLRKDLKEIFIKDE